MLGICGWRGGHYLGLRKQAVSAAGIIVADKAKKKKALETNLESLSQQLGGRPNNSSPFHDFLNTGLFRSNRDLFTHYPISNISQTSENRTNGGLQLAALICYHVYTLYANSWDNLEI